ncbi:MAG: hypothetical protein AAF654_13925 [Myxococcota bacterium]
MNSSFDHPHDRQMHSGLAFFHNHALAADMSDYAGPSVGDDGYVRLTADTDVIFTTADYAEDGRLRVNVDKRRRWHMRGMTSTHLMEWGRELAEWPVEGREVARALSAF